ncbi:YjbH domain-containing protein [SAR86 cluster bacterium]|nr:YjbH domain-containing protein [SAR86 cluster bacterium]
MKYFFCGNISLLLVLLSANLHSDLGPYIYKYSKYPSHSNNGTIGLIQMPSARFMPEGSVAFNLSNVDPYQRGSIIGTPFNWFEASYQYTDVDNALYSLSPEFSGDQTYKDKSFDAKFLLLKESNYFPAIAFGARDLAGTGVFSAEYLVASKRLNNFDFTLGIGWGTFSDHGIKNPFRYIDDEFETRDVSSNETQGGEFSIGNYLSGKDVGIFGGVEVYLPNFRGARFKVEYDSTDYEKEGFPFGKQSFNFAFKNVRQPSSKVNFGVVYPISDNFHLKLFHVKGHTLSFGFSFQGDFGKKTPLIKKKDSHIEVPDKEIYKIVTTRSDENLYKASLLHLNPRELKLQTAQVSDDTLKVAYSQSKHASWMRSTGRVLRVIDEIAPEKIKTIEVGNVNGGLGMFKMKIDRDDFSQNLNSNTPLVALKDAEITPFNYVREDYDFTPRVEFPQLFWSIVPTLRMQIGGPDGFFFGNVRLSGKAELSLARNISVKASASYGLTDNFEDLKLLSDSVLPHVRTDIVSYLREGRGLTLDTLQVDRFFKFGDDFYSIFDSMLFASRDLKSL